VWAIFNGRNKALFHRVGVGFSGDAFEQVSGEPVARIGIREDAPGWVKSHFVGPVADAVAERAIVVGAVHGRLVADAGGVAEQLVRGDRAEPWGRPARYFEIGRIEIELVFDGEPDTAAAVSCLVVDPSRKSMPGRTGSPVSTLATPRTCE